MTDIKKLQEGGIHTVTALAHAPRKELLAIKGISEAKVEKMQKEGSPFIQAVMWSSSCERMESKAI